VPGGEVPVIGDRDGRWHDLRPLTADITGEFLRERLGEARAALAAGALPAFPEEVARYGSPLRPGKIVCVGLNYRDHAAESGLPVPAEPILFLKAGDTVVGPDDPVSIPRGSRKTDWEVELGVVIGAPARYLDGPGDAASVIAGYVISHDVSERAFQLERGGQWDKGKNCETFNPLGPWIVTPDEVGDFQDLGLRLWVNDVLRQDGCTKDMIFGVHEIVHYTSQFMVLHPGDVISTGTPAGVALGRAGVPFLRAGDVVDIEIDRLGRQRQLLVQA
jgi:2-keto-4-pentenoate hydratase/2-oxohepta-3-ene-1,7-dioic acid hydratase in catechol pathway